MRQFLDWMRAGLTPSLEDRAQVRFPAALFFLVFLVRPLRLVIRHGTRVLDRPRRI